MTPPPFDFLPLHHRQLLATDFISLYVGIRTFPSRPLPLGSPPPRLNITLTLACSQCPWGSMHSTSWVLQRPRTSRLYTVMVVVMPPSAPWKAWRETTTCITKSRLHVRLSGDALAVCTSTRVRGKSLLPSGVRKLGVRE